MRGNYNRLLHTQDSQQRNSKMVQRNADTKMKILEEKLTAAEQALELCRDDLFMIQPLCRISDGSVIRAFESLSEQVINWIDNETAGFEKDTQDAPIGWPFSGSKNSDVARFIQTHPSAGEYMCRHVVSGETLADESIHADHFKPMHRG